MRSANALHRHEYFSFCRACDGPTARRAQGRHDQPRLRKEPRRRGDHAWQRAAAWHASDGGRGGRRRARCEHLCVHRFRERGVDRRNSRCAPAARVEQKARSEADRQRLHVAAVCKGTARAVTRSRCVHRSGPGKGSWRDRGEPRGARFHLARSGERKLGTCATPRHPAADLHTELGYASVSPDATATARM